MEEQPVGQASLADLIFQLCVNFLMYALLILVMYMMVRFYLEEDFEFDERYRSVSTVEEDNDKSLEAEGAEIEMTAAEGGGDAGGEAETPSSIVAAIPTLIKGMFSSDTPSKVNKKKGNFLNLNEWGEPEGTQQEVIQRAVFCAVGLNA